MEKATIIIYNLTLYCFYGGFQLNKNFIDSVNLFSCKFLHIVSKLQEEKNIVCSPLSIYISLFAIAVGATADTQKEILHAMGITQENKNNIIQHIPNLLREICFDNKEQALIIANSIWVSNEYTIKDSFQRYMKNLGNTDVFSLNFHDANAGNYISSWISKKTNDSINPFLSVSSDLLISIINTVYFESKWNYAFDKEDTKKDFFYMNKEKKVECDFMHKKLHGHNYVIGDGYKASSIPFEKGEIVFILPDENRTIDEFTRSPEKIFEITTMSQAKKGTVLFQIPKFTLKSSVALISILKQMGIQKAFSRDAQINGISETALFISEIKQENFIEMNETGAKAVAYTITCGEVLGSFNIEDLLFDEEMIELFLERPFLYAVKIFAKNSSFLLFMGICSNPTDE